MRVSLLMLALAGCVKNTTPVDPYAHGPKNADIVDRPGDLTYPEASFEVPKAADFRHEIDGVPVYIATTKEFPLVDIRFTFKGGRYLEPQGKWGVGSATAELVHHGGTAEVGADEIDERFAFLAANVGVSVGTETSSASINCLKSNLDESFGLFMDMLRNPAWDADKLALHKSNTIDRMKQRNDDAGNIARRENNRLQWGDAHYLSRVSTAAMIEGLTEEDLASFHKTLFHPGNLTISVTGDVEPDEILPILEKALEGWEKGERAADPPASRHKRTPGLFHVQKDIPQGKVRVSGPGITRDDPDHIKLAVMNEILGGGGFTSRLTKRIRSDEGLAYGAYSGWANRVYFPGSFYAGYDSKNPTVARALDIVMEEVERIQNEPVSEDELNTAKASMIETFPRRFETRASVVGTFVNDEMTGRAEDYWSTWRSEVDAVTAEDVMAAAKKHLDTDQLTILIVGDWEPISKGDVDGKASMEPYGEPTVIPLRDPLTQEPLGE